MKNCEKNEAKLELYQKLAEAEAQIENGKEIESYILNTLYNKDAANNG